MRKILFIIPIFLVSCSSNKFPSFSEAKYACDQWADKGVRFDKWSPSYFDTFYKTSRECESDRETKQWLGWEWIDTSTNKTVRKNYKYNQQETSKLLKVVEKRFYY